MLKIIPRRDFLKISVAASTSLAVPYISGCRKSSLNKRPNILIILTDQQHAKMMSCIGNPYLQTPANYREKSPNVYTSAPSLNSPTCPTLLWS